MTIGLEFSLTAGPHVMQHENSADTRENRPQQMVRAAEVKGFKPGADDVVAKLLHSDSVGSRVQLTRLWRTAEEKVSWMVARYLTLALLAWFDSLAPVCFL